MYTCLKAGLPSGQSSVRVKCAVIMIMRATQKNRMSKPVTSTVLGRKRSCSTVLFGQPTVEKGNCAAEYQVSSTSGSRVSFLPGACDCASASLRAT